MDLKDYIKIDWEFWMLSLKVTANSNKTEFFWVLWNGTLKLRLKSIPEKWKANIELINFISKELWINKNLIKIISWLSSQNKLVKIDL